MVRLLLGIGVIGAATYFNVRLGVPPDQPAAVAVSMPPAVHRPVTPPKVGPAAPRDAVVAFDAYPQHPVEPWPAAQDNTVATPEVTKPSSDTPRVPAPPEAAAFPVAPPAVRLPVVRPPPVRPIAPAAAVVVPTIPDPLPAGTGLHLRIVYVPSDQAEAPRIDALMQRLRGQDSDIATATAAPGPVAGGGVIYFFPNDRAGAGRVAASLAAMTKRAEPVMLAHANPLPRPGTVEIRLPLRVGKDLTQ